MTNEIRILSVLRKHYEEKALSTNSQEDADIHNALLHAIKALESSISIPSGATNGDVIKSMFPDSHIVFSKEYGYHYVYVSADCEGSSWKIREEWWNAPYREGDVK